MGGVPFLTIPIKVQMPKVTLIIKIITLPKNYKNPNIANIYLVFMIIQELVRKAMFDRFNILITVNARGV